MPDFYDTDVSVQGLCATSQQTFRDSPGSGAPPPVPRTRSPGPGPPDPDPGPPDRGHLGLAEVLADQGVRGPVGARVPGLLDPQAGMAGRDPGHRAQGRSHGLVFVAGLSGDMEGDQSAPAIRGHKPSVAGTEGRDDVPRGLREGG